MAVQWTRTQVRVIRRWQDDDCATGDSKVMDEQGRIWHTQINIDPHQKTGEVRGWDYGDRIKDIR